MPTTEVLSPALTILNILKLVVLRVLAATFKPKNQITTYRCDEMIINTSLHYYSLHCPQCYILFWLCQVECKNPFYLHWIACIKGYQYKHHAVKQRIEIIQNLLDNIFKWISCDLFLSCICLEKTSNASTAVPHDFLKTYSMQQCKCSSTVRGRFRFEIAS